MSNILDEAQAAVDDRHAAYDIPGRNFVRIAKAWSLVFEHEVTPEQVALCMIALKFCRELYSHKRDNLVDIAGYAQCLEELAEGDNKEQVPDWTPGYRFRVRQPAPWEIQPHYRGDWRVTCGSGCDDNQ